VGSWHLLISYIIPLVLIKVWGFREGVFPS